jgi:hypothetical protein
VVDAAEETAELDGDHTGGRGGDHSGELGGARTGGTAGYADVRELREGPPAPAERAPRPVPEPESAW